MPRSIAKRDEAWLAARTKRAKECIEWTGAVDKDGYGVMEYRAPGERTRNMRVHRFAFWLSTGAPAPDGVLVLHACDNPRCCNPRHLFTGTQADNIADRGAKGRGHRPKGSLHPQTSLTENDVRSIRRRFAGGERNMHLADEFNVSRPTISDIVKRRSWKHIE